jgi:heme/copper-type cytochrome/quinol oxidase subunit 1
VSWRKPIPAGNDPWDGHTLEWFTTSPPPHHNFNRLPPVRSERPTWDFYHPDALAIRHVKANGHRKPEPVSVGGNGHPTGSDSDTDGSSGSGGGSDGHGDSEG